MQSATQMPPLLYFLQDRHWLGPGPQQPSEEQRGSHTKFSPTGGRMKLLYYCRQGLRRCLAASLTAIISGSVVLNVDVFVAALLAGAAAEQARPVDSVMVAQPLVSRDVDAAIVYPPKGAQPQRGQGGDLHHHQGVAPEHQPAKQRTVIPSRGTPASPLSVIRKDQQRELHRNRTAGESRSALPRQQNRASPLLCAVGNVYNLGLI